MTVDDAPEHRAFPRRPRLDSLQLLRAAAALLVLLYHLVTMGAFGWITPDGAPTLPLGYFVAIGFAGVDLFFVISGVVMVLTCYDRFGQPGASAEFLVRRALRVYPLYWLATAAVLAICWFAPGLAAREKFDAAGIAKSLALWPQTTFPVVAVGWTLVCEMYFYVVFAVMLLLPRRFLPLLLAGWAAATIALAAAWDVARLPLTGHDRLLIVPPASPLALEFISGCAIGYASRQTTLRASSLALAFGIILLFIVGGGVGLISPAAAQFGAARLLVFGVAAVAMVYGLVARDFAGGVQAPRWVTFWGDASYSTYLTHVYVLAAVAAVSSRWSLSPIASRWAISTIALAGCAAVAALCHLAIERPLQRLASRARPARAQNSARPAPPPPLLPPAPAKRP
jgi:peptidoglycan/LPS O-acetylase OafA/YrhL